MKYVTSKEMKNEKVLNELLAEGYVGITETGYAVKEITSSDDKIIINMLCELESESGVEEC